MEVKAFSVDGDCEQMAAVLTPRDTPPAVNYWSIITGEEIKSLQLATNHDVFRFAKKNTIVVTAGKYEIHVWNLEEDRATLAMEITVREWTAFDVARSGDVIAVAYYGDDGIRFFDASTGALLAVYRGHTNRIDSLQFSPQGDRLVSTSDHDVTTRVWDTTKAALSANPPSITQDCYFFRVQFSPDGKYIVAIAWEDPRIFVWDRKTGIYPTTLTGHTNNVIALAFSPDSSILATVSQVGSVRLWAMGASATHPRMISRRAIIEPVDVAGMAFNSNGTLLALVSYVDESFMVSIYDILNHGRPEVGEQIFQSKPVNGNLPQLIRFSPNESLARFFRVRTNEAALVWDYEKDLVEEHSSDEVAHSMWVLPFDIENRGGKSEWIMATRNKRRLFWLPPRRTPHFTCVDAQGDRLAIGSEFGVLTLLDTSRLQNI
jgi:WD40 repeat protein